MNEEKSRDSAKKMHTNMNSNQWKIVRLDHMALTECEIEECVESIGELLNRGQKKIAISISPKHYPYSKFLSLIIRCNKLVKKCGGEMVVIQNNQEFLKTITITNLDRHIAFVTNEEEIR